MRHAAMLRMCLFASMISGAGAAIAAADGTALQPLDRRNDADLRVIDAKGNTIIGHAALAAMPKTDLNLWVAVNQFL